MPLPNKELRELLCMVCGREHQIWFTQNDVWNAVMRYPDGREASEKIPFICPDSEEHRFKPPVDTKALLTQAFAAVRPENKKGVNMPTSCPDRRPGCLVMHYENVITGENAAFNTALTDYDQNVKKYLEEME
jgi:hypothetical protein